MLEDHPIFLIEKDTKTLRGIYIFVYAKSLKGVTAGVTRLQAVTVFVTG
jgi:hypothetical protein